MTTQTTQTTDLRNCDLNTLTSEIRVAVGAYRDSAKRLVDITKVVVGRYWGEVGFINDGFTPDVAAKFANECRDMPRLQNQLVQIFRQTMCVKATVTKDTDGFKTVKLESNKKKLPKDTIELRLNAAKAFLNSSITTLMDYNKVSKPVTKDDGVLGFMEQMKKSETALKSLEKAVNEINDPEALRRLLIDLESKVEFIKTKIPSPLADTASQEEIDSAAVESDEAVDASLEEELAQA